MRSTTKICRKSDEFVYGEKGGSISLNLCLVIFFFNLAAPGPASFKMKIAAITVFTDGTEKEKL